jgi:hypothetical protein
MMRVLILRKEKILFKVANAHFGVSAYCRYLTLNRKDGQTGKREVWGACPHVA